MTVIISINNSKYAHAHSDILEEMELLNKHLSFHQPGFEYSPAFQNGYWNGIVHLIDKNNNFQLGLLDTAKTFLQKEKIDYKVLDYRKIVDKAEPMEIELQLQTAGKTPRPYQLETVKTLMQYDRGIAKLATGAGKCNRYDSLHITEYGLLDYTELLGEIKLNPRELLSFESSVATPLTVSKTDLTSHIYRDGISNSLQIINECGFELTATPKHKIKIIDGNGALKWKDLRELKLGDYTVIAPKTQIFGSENIDLDDAYWYGLLMGDGGMTSKSKVILTNSDKYILDFARLYLKNKGLSCKEYKDKLSKAIDITVHNIQYRQKLFNLGFDYCKSIHKTLPVFIRKLAKQPLAMVVRGLYETDGWIGKGKNRPTIEIGLSNKKLIDQLQLILLNFGIISHRRIKKTYREDNHQLSIYKDYIDIFCKEIGFNPNGRKFQELQNELNNYNAKSNTNVNIVPNQADNIQKLIEQIKWKHGTWLDCPIKRGTIISWYRSKARRNPSKENLKIFLLWLKNKYGETELIQNMLRLCEGDLFYSKIVKIDKIKSDNYDFVVPKTHSFVSQGFINHNTMISALLTAAVNKPTLILVISLDLLEQFYTLFTELFNEPIGRIGDGQVKIERINIATLWTVAKSIGIKDKDLFEENEGYKEKFDQSSVEKIKELISTSKVIIFDECHLASCASLQKLYKETNAEHLYGFSATPKKDGEDAILVNAVFGDVKINIPASTLIEQKYLIKPIIKFLPIPQIKLSTNKYAGVYKEYIVENETRNNIIVNTAAKLIENNYKTLILFRVINHGKILFDLCQEKGLKCGLLWGNDKLERREEIKKQLIDGKIDLIIASTIFECGVDIPCLNALILASGGKSSVKTLQRVGRVLRPAPNKTHCRVIDFYDNAKYLRNHSKTRLKIYESEPGFQILK